jgi:hypothetical protein
MNPQKVNISKTEDACQTQPVVVSSLEESMNAESPTVPAAVEKSTGAGVVDKDALTSELKISKCYKSACCMVFTQKEAIECFSDEFVSFMAKNPEFRSDVARHNGNINILDELAEVVREGFPNNIVTILDCANACYSIALSMLVDRKKLLK